MDLTPRKVARGVAIGRVLYGAALMSVPRTAMGPAGRDVEGPMVWMGRTLGVRDLVLGVGTLVALAGDPVAATRWVQVGALADGLDIANAVVFRRELETAGLVGVALLAVPATLGGLWAARHLRS